MRNFFKYIIKFSTYLKIASILCIICLIFAYMCPFVHPASFWILPFFGLAYPITIIFAVFFLLCWTIVRSRWAIVMLVVILCGGSLHFRMLGTTRNSELIPSESTVFHVMSYNCQLMGLYEGNAANKIIKRNKIIKYIKEVNPDIVCFQEFYHQDPPTKFTTRDTLIKILGMPYYQERYSHKLVGRQNFGIALLSKYPMISRGGVVIDSAGSKSDNYCVFADIVKKQDTVRIYNIHLQSVKFQQDDYAIFGEEEFQSGKLKSNVTGMVNKLKFAYQRRGDQAQKVLEHASKSPFPVIFCGDFNDTPMSYCYNLFNRNYLDAFKNCSFGIGSTYAGKVPAGRIDYMFYGPELQSSGFNIQKNNISDHYAINCYFWKNKLHQSVQKTTNPS